MVAFSGAPVAIRTRDLRFRNLRRKNDKPNEFNGLGCSVIVPDNSRDTLPANAAGVESEATSVHLSPDLASIVVAWSSIPQVKKRRLMRFLRLILSRIAVSEHN